MFVELHIIQNFAPSCLNRDDTNSPKDCEFGGFRRARISSQCLKRAIRWHPTFAQHVSTDIGNRTKRLVATLRDVLVAEGKPEEQVTAVVPAVVEAMMGKLKGEDTAVLVYLGADEVARIKSIISDNWDALVAAAAGADAKPAKKAKSDALQDAAKAAAAGFRPATKAADIALFGRMVAENTDMNVDAACQVAHAISTHKVSMEMDFFTAVDDLQPDEEPGAGMMGTVEFNSSCFYRYALLDTVQLAANLGGDDALARETVEAFLHAAIVAIPSARQNSMAAQNQPSFVLAVVRDGSAPWSLANAFERPVRPAESKGLVQQSVEALAAYWGQLATMYGEEGILATALCTLCEPDLGSLAAARKSTVADVVGAVRDAIAGGE